MALSMFSMTSTLSKRVNKSTPADVTVITSPSPVAVGGGDWTNTSILSAQTSIACSNISSDGSSIVVCTVAFEVFVSTNYGVSFKKISNLPNKPLTISISNGGNYILASDGSSNCLIYTNSTQSWATMYYTLTNDRIYTVIGKGVCMSSTGQYMIAYIIGVSGANIGVYVNNNYGNNANWTFVLTDTKVNSVYSMNSSGQYMMLASNTGSVSYYYYSQDYGVSFAKIYINLSTTNFKSLYISSSGVFTCLIGSGGSANNVILSKSIANTASGIFSQIHTTLRTRITANLGKNPICSNENGSVIFYMDAGLGACLMSTDYLMTNMGGLYGINFNISTQIYGSVTAKYILSHDVTNNDLKLLNNTLSS